MPTLTERFVADIEGLSDLPSLSPVLAHLIATLGREDASVAEVAAIIRQDPVIAARVLRSATSAPYIGRSPVSSIRDALLRLGLARIRRLALVASLYDAVPVRGTRAAREIFWQHSLGVAHGSEIIARYAVGSPEDLDPESVFLAGLLHDLGLLVLESHYPKESSAVKRYAGIQSVPLCLAGLEVLQTDHGELGALLASHWTMPDSIAFAIRAHHRFDQAPPEHRWNAAIIHLADHLVSQEPIADLREGSAECFDGAVTEILGLSPDAVAQIIEETRTEARKAATVLSASSVEALSLAGLLAGVCFRPMSPSSDPGVAAELTRLSVIITRLSRGLSLADEPARDRKSTRLNSSHTVISYAVFCLKKKNRNKNNHTNSIMSC